jgi:hypothetical protein
MSGPFPHDPYPDATTASLPLTAVAVPDGLLPEGMSAVSLRIRDNYPLHPDEEKAVQTRAFLAPGNLLGSLFAGSRFEVSSL